MLLYYIIIILLIIDNVKLGLCRLLDLKTYYVLSFLFLYLMKYKKKIYILKL